jgi:uncharacterized repeat protein (TIGR03803 family)
MAPARDGAGPQAGLILDTSGALYGTTYQGGLYGLGTVFKLDRDYHLGRRLEGDGAP